MASMGFLQGGPRTGTCRLRPAGKGAEAFLLGAVGGESVAYPQV